MRDAGLVVCLTPFASEAMCSYADFILPIAPFTETSGTFSNFEGHWQAFAAVTQPHYDSKPGWKVLRALANFFELTGFDYKTVQEVQAELKHHLEAAPALVYQPSHWTFPTAAKTLHRLGAWPMYRSDPLVRRSQPLQDTITAEDRCLGLNTSTAKTLGFNQGDLILAQQEQQEILLPLEINDRLADDTVWLAAGLEETMGFGTSGMPILLKRGQ